GAASTSPPGDLASSDGGTASIDGSLGPGAGEDASLPSDECSLGDALCLTHDSRRSCEKTPSGARWTDATCATGSGCVRGECVKSACSDECSLGDLSGAKTCATYDMASGAWVGTDPAGSMDDRARAYEMWLRRDGLAFGGVGSAHYSDPPTYAHVDVMNGLGDSALWTGTYLAAESLRLQATGAPDARVRIRKLVDTLHLFFTVSGDPGMLARIVRPAGATPGFATPDLDCASGSKSIHCGVSHGGASYDYFGHISRDQYQGVMLGYELAYEALTAEDEDARAIIRSDVVTFVKELMRERTLPVALVYNGVPIPVTNVNLRFVVTSAAEMDGGKLTIELNGSNVNDANMFGFQEFTPDLADIVHQLPGLGFVPPIVRSSSAIMLASFFRVALKVTDGVPAAKADHDAILSYYTSHSGTGGNVSQWLAIAKQWSDNPGCGNGYYANNITMEPMFNLARLEDDPARSSIVKTDVLKSLLWPAYVNTKNVFFSFIYAGVSSGVDPSVTTSAAAQLAQFPPPPRVLAPVNLVSDPRYMPHDGSCANQVDHATAVDVGDRPAGDFMWQRAPWSLLDDGNAAQGEPGVDYLVAYWMGRQAKFLTDDTPTRCLAYH
ncbi:MAG: hypothetical protein ABIP89_17920, partial [Polyangiaceae bacterium]